jgi:hypothetical protein
MSTSPKTESKTDRFLRTKTLTNPNESVWLRFCDAVEDRRWLDVELMFNDVDLMVQGGWAPLFSSQRAAKRYLVLVDGQMNAALYGDASE